MCVGAGSGRMAWSVFETGEGSCSGACVGSGSGVGVWSVAGMRADAASAVSFT